MQLDITQTDVITSTIQNYSVPAGTIDNASGNGETYYYNSKFKEKLGYYQNIPEYKKAIDTYATWVLGKGYFVGTHDKVILEHITGWGEDSFLSILWNMLVVKKFNGDSYSEIIREKNTLVNLKPLSPEKIVHVVNKNGTLKGYDYIQGNGEKKRFKPEEILHLCNDRIADQIHGTSIGDCVKEIIDFRHEALADLRRITHRSTIRVLYVDEDDPTRRTNLKRDYADAIKRGELLILPGKPKDAGFQDLSVPPIEAFMQTIQYLENFFYQAAGVPKSVVGGTQDTTEAAAKVGMVVFDPIYIREITDLQMDIWNQLGIKIQFTGQKSMMDNVQTDEAKNTGQTKLEMQGSQ